MQTTGGARFQEDWHVPLLLVVRAVRQVLEALLGEDEPVLVRPDRYVAYRSAEEAADPTAALKSALEHILATQLA